MKGECVRFYLYCFFWGGGGIFCGSFFFGGRGVFKILFKELGFQTFSEDGQELCCPSISGKLVPSLTWVHLTF